MYAKQFLIVLFILALSACSSLTTQSDAQESMALFDKAQQAYQEGLLEEAEAHFIEITKLNPEFYEAWFRLGNIYVRTGQLKAAERMFEQCARLKPNEFKAWNNLAVTYVKQAIAILKEGKQHMMIGSSEDIHANEMATRLIDAIAKPQKN